MTTFVESVNYRASYERLGPGLVEMQRTIERPDVGVDREAYPVWTIAFGTRIDGPVYLARPGTRVQVRTGSAVFVPPFRIVEWQVGPGRIDYIAYLSRSALPADMPGEPILFPVDRFVRPRTEADLFALVRARRSETPVSAEEPPSALARRVKDALDRSFPADVRLGDLAASLRCAHPVLTRYFRRAYGLSPAKYCSMLRLFEAQMQLLLGGTTVHDVAAGVGFGDVSQFNKQFKALMRATPSAFKAAIGQLLRRSS
jgi:AraC-like DNA-binding protein